MTDLQRLAEAIYTAGNISGIPWAQASVWARGKAERQALAALGELDRQESIACNGYGVSPDGA